MVLSGALGAHHGTGYGVSPRENLKFVRKSNLRLSSKLNLTFSMVEFNTYNHYAAYLAGLLLAAYLNRPQPLFIGRRLSRSLWLAALVTLFLIPFSTYPFITMDAIPVNVLSMSYTGVKRTLWIGAFSWIILACSSFARTGLIGQVLSAKMWQPLSRLTFCIYLTQSLVVWVYAYQGRSLHYLSHYNTVIRAGTMVLRVTL